MYKKQKRLNMFFSLCLGLSIFVSSIVCEKVNVCTADAFHTDIASKVAFAEIMLKDAKKTWNNFESITQQIFNENFENQPKEVVAQKVGVIIVEGLKAFDGILNVFYLFEGDMLPENEIRDEALREKTKKIKKELNTFVFFTVKERIYNFIDEFAKNSPVPANVEEFRLNIKKLFPSLTYYVLANADEYFVVNMAIVTRITLSETLLRNAKEAWNNCKDHAQQICDTNFEKLTAKEIVQKIGVVFIEGCEIFDVILNISGLKLKECEIRDEALREKTKKIKKELANLMFSIMQEVSNFIGKVSDVEKPRPIFEKSLLSLIYNKERVADITKDCQYKDIDLSGMLKSIVAKHTDTSQNKKTTLEDLLGLVNKKKYVTFWFMMSQNSEMRQKFTKILPDEVGSFLLHLLISKEMLFSTSCCF